MRAAHHNAYHAGHHRFAVFTAGATFVLLIAGALVTSNDAGLAVPDWPTSFGSLYKIPPMVGGVKYEHGHRMVAQFVGLLTIVLAVWTQRVEPRGWMRGLGWGALALVIVQGVLGGVTVLFFLPPWVSTAHATLAQAFFSTVVLMALFTSRGWVEEESRMALDVRRPRLATLAAWSAAAIVLQLILGAAFRHSGMKLLPHLILAVVVTALILWTSVRALMDYAHAPEIFRPALVLLVLLVVQLGLGFGAYLTRVEWSQDAPQPLASMVATTVAHVAAGALLLAASVVLVAQTRRHLADPDEIRHDHRHKTHTPKAVHA
ncbi:MAG TPA: COX15/CtaA family protein [Terriglobales bacterium]|nr:COX15/CtaA family protein [Terriglobales bacterium]